jgi:colanic acid/amylovoran biosynthesis glycosyltransferase
MKVHSPLSMLNPLTHSQPNVLIFNGRLLPKSETFIRAQSEGLQQFTPYYTGVRQIDGLALPPDRTLVINSGQIWGTAAEALFKFTGLAPTLVPRLQTLNPVLIHAHFGVCGTLALPLARSLKLPLVVTFHGLDATMSDAHARQDSVTTRLYLQRREQLKQDATLFITVSEFIKGHLLRQGFPAEKIKVHYIGVDTKHFQPNPQTPRESIVLFVGRLVEKKGCEYLIRAMGQVQAQRPDVKLVVIGEGILRSDLEAKARTLLKNYEFLGIQPSEVVKSWMNRASILAAPSVTGANGDSEGLPIVILEAQSMGLPIVSTVHAGIPEAVIHEKTGFLAPERDSDTLAEAISRLLAEPELWRAMSQAGMERIRSSFDLHQQTRKLEHLYDQILQQKEA